MNDRKETVLFICTHNSARSQMAEGLLRARHGERYEAFSAGTEPASVNPLAVRVMGEIGIDISHHASKSTGQFQGREFDHVITLCDNAKTACPFFPGAKNRMHRGFRDPADAKGTDAEMLEAFRRARDDIQKWIDLTFGPEKKPRQKPISFG